MAITSQVKNERSFGEYILQNWQQAGLLKPSMIKPLIATLEQYIWGLTPFLTFYA